MSSSRRPRSDALSPSGLYRASQPDPAGVEAAAELLLGSRHPVIAVGDGVARARAQDELVALAELVGAPVWYEGQHHQIDFPTSHPSARVRTPVEAAGLRKAFEGADAILLVGGSFFEEVWFEPGSPFPDGAALIQIDEAPGRLALNFPVRVGLLASPRYALRAIREAVEAGATPAFREAAAERNRALARARDAEAAAQRARAEGRWDQEPIAVPRLMADLRDALPPGPCSSTRPSPRRSTSRARSRSIARATTTARAAAASARRCPAPSGSSSRIPTARWWPSPATARPCTRSRRCGRRRTAISPSCTSSSTTASTASSSTTWTPTAAASACPAAARIPRWISPIRSWASWRWRTAWAWPASASPSRESCPRRCARPSMPRAPYVLDVVVESFR